MSRTPNAIAQSVGRWRASLRRHPAVGVCLGLTAALVLARGAVEGQLLKSVAYLSAMVLCATVTDLVLIARATTSEALVVRSPPRESLIIGVGATIGFAALWVHKLHPELVEAYPAARIGLLLLSVGFVFPIVPAVYLLAARYPPKQIGFAGRGLTCLPWLLPPLALVTGGAALLTDPAGVTLASAMDEFGSWPALIVGTFVAAALPEELFRVLAQTRFGALTTKATGWVVASLAWGLLHVPVWYAGSGDLADAMWGAIRIVPLGLMWGYVTHRTGSIWTAWVLHGTNLWGLQNF